MDNSKRKNILGILYLNHDPAACLLRDGKIIAMVEEERFIRIKHADKHFPINAIKFCLKEGNINMKDVDVIAIGWDVNDYLNKMPSFFSGLKEKYKDIIDEDSIKWMEKGVKRFNPETYTNSIIENLKKYGYEEKEIPEIKYINHHECHALTAYCCSGFEDAIVLTLDGHGEANCTVLWKAQNGKLEKIKEFDIPHSLGWYYSAFTKFLGLGSYGGEGKTMGLAPYGKPNENFRKKIGNILKIKEEGYEIDPSYICYGKKSHGTGYTDKFLEMFGEQPKDGNFSQDHKDLAFEAQRRLEEVAVHLVNILIKKTGIKNLCIAGGVAMNCKMNGYIWKNTNLDNIFIQPVSGDEGSILGACMKVYTNNGGNPKDFEKMQHTLYGPQYSNDEVLEVLKKFNLSYEKPEEIEKDAAKLIADGKIIGWFQGRMEAGKRALGDRSILADPRSIELKDLVNDKVKFRESWRPFCPSLLSEKVRNYLDKPYDAPFMILAFDLKKDKLNKVPGIVHVDGTIRPQLVKKEINPKYWKLIKEFENVTGEAILLNTSFNIKGEPIVCSPEDAVNCFLKTGIDVLVINDYLIKTK